MEVFFRFPHTPHLCWLGQGSPRHDKVLSLNEVDDLLSGVVVVEEKIDGANLGISMMTDGNLRAQNRGQYINIPYGGQFSRLGEWFTYHSDALVGNLTGNIILFGEWCAAKHSLAYNSLPDWFVLFDVYDRVEKRFWSTVRRNELAANIGLVTVACLYKGPAKVSDLNIMLDGCESSYRVGSPEGVVVRKESGGWLDGRAKLVRAEFNQSIDDHWRSRTIEWNRLRSQSDRRID